MLKDITLGQYYSTDSLMHRLDPRLKIRATIAYIILLLLDRNVVLFGMLTLIFLVAVIMSKVPVGHMVKGSRSILVVVVLCSAINIFTTPGTGGVTLLGLTATGAGLVKFGFVVWRMVLMIFMSSLLMYTTTPTELTDGLEKCFHLSGNVAMGITIAMRFLSVLSQELDRIMKAQEARGASFHKGGPVKRVKAMSKVLVPLFQNSIDRATNLGEAMDARCYTGGKGRTKLKPLVYDGKDVIGYVVLLLVIVFGVYFAIKF
ncbi:MAG: energy-coupling factor transporter transmembrane protein EcfT [Lachnospiraceae bacterium]|nr:energy-coupling factor transporter transmembrane protein EcfT [Lachnospiraceae bacterium]